MSLHDHGASCAVDSHLELFHFSIYQFDCNCKQADGGTQTFFTKLTDASSLQGKFGPSCEVQDVCGHFRFKHCMKHIFPQVVEMLKFC